MWVKVRVGESPRSAPDLPLREPANRPQSPVGKATRTCYATPSGGACCTALQAYQATMCLVRKGGFEFGRRGPSLRIASEIKTGTFVRTPSHAFAPSWFQNWFQPRRSRELGCGSAGDAGCRFVGGVGRPLAAVVQPPVSGTPSAEANLGGASQGRKNDLGSCGRCRCTSS